MYPNPDGSSYPSGRTATTSMNTTSDYEAKATDQARAYGNPDTWTQALLDSLNNGKPITTKTKE